LHRARTALITAVTVRRMAVEEIDAERGDDEDQDEGDEPPAGASRRPPWATGGA